MLTVSQDLRSEREKCDFNIQELTYYLDGGEKNTKDRRWLEEQMLSVKELFDETPEEYLSHKEKYENAIRKAVVFYRKMSQLQDPNQTELERARLSYGTLLQTAVFKEISPFGLHAAMFIPTIAGQADDEQKSYWLKKAMNMEIIGTYAQTELGHGTFLRGLETTATYDPKTEEFILHSPTLTSYKWWPGNLAHTANYCVVMAQLYIDGKGYGIQPFLVQVRDSETHMPLPGIKLGEIGAKLGFNTVNNGFLGFEHHRIPRNRMLMKNAQVAKDGTFTTSPNRKLTYGTMVYVRVMIVNSVSNHLARAVTIAIRYSAVRRQSQLNPKEPEVQVLDYVTQQHKLFTALATSHAFKSTAKWLWNVYANVTKDLEAGKLDDLPELHAMACCLKAVCSSDASTMIERCRLSCGGHGYMLSSNLPQIYGTATATCTYEGENTVLLLQTARFLVKTWNQSLEGKPLTSTTSYIKESISHKKWDNSVEGIIKGYQKVAARKLKSAVASLKEYTKTGLSPEDAWNMTSVQLIAVSEYEEIEFLVDKAYNSILASLFSKQAKMFYRTVGRPFVLSAHCRAVILSTFKSEVEKASASMSAPLGRVLSQLVELCAIYWLLEKLGDFLLYTSISQKDVTELQSKYEGLLQTIRPNAVGLVDAFDFRDEILNSTLGAYDGRVYERLMEEALKSPLNAEPVNQSFHKYLKPFMQGKL